MAQQERRTRIGNTAMNPEKYTERLRGFLQSAQGLAMRESHQRLAPEHLLKVMLDDPNGLAANLVQNAGGDPAVALDEVVAAVARIPRVGGPGAESVVMHPATARILHNIEE